MLKFLGLGSSAPVINISQDKIVKEGYLEKESRLLKNWRQYLILYLLENWQNSIKLKVEKCHFKISGNSVFPTYSNSETKDL